MSDYAHAMAVPHEPMSMRQAEAEVVSRVLAQIPDVRVGSHGLGYGSPLAGIGGGDSLTDGASEAWGGVVVIRASSEAHVIGSYHAQMLVPRVALESSSGPVGDGAALNFSPHLQIRRVDLS